MKTKKSVSRHYNKISHLYDNRYTGLLGKYFRAIEENYILQAVDFKNKKALDLGTGTGRFAFLLADKAQKVVGIDNSVKMIAVAKSKLKKINKKNVSFQEMDAENLAFKENSFDIVLAIGLFEYIKNLSPFLTEIKRVLKENGCLIFTILNKNWFWKRKSGKNQYGYSLAEHDLARIKKVLQALNFQLINFQGVFFIPKRNLLLQTSQKVGLGRVCLKIIVGLDKLLNKLPAVRKRAGVFIISSRKTKNF